jgi:transposase-like protein/IS1 family transposase
MVCHNCELQTKKFGKDRKGNQRFRCNGCKKTFSELQDRPLGTMRLPMEKALQVLQLLVEGVSIRSTERITGVEKKTILSLLERVGERCEMLLENLIRNVPVKDVQCDELWAFVQMKEKTKTKKALTTEKLGDAYCFVAIERTSKLILSWHLGRRSAGDTEVFINKLDHATEGEFQVTTDGFAPYRDAIGFTLGGRTDFAQLVKVYGEAPDEHRYSPARVLGTKAEPQHGRPDPNRVCTSHVERQNLTIRMQMRRLTRLTNAFSKKWENLKAAYALHFAHYNFCRVHSSIRCTPAMEAGITKSVWTLKDLLTA